MKTLILILTSAILSSCSTKQQAPDQFDSALSEIALDMFNTKPLPNLYK